MPELQHLHHQLRLHFKTLSDAREPAPVFFLEHDLNDDALAELTECLAIALEAQPFLRSSFWHSRYLPMLVLASEVGYRYGGLGSEYWPALEERLRTRLNEEAKDAIEWYFEQNEGATRTRPVASRRSERFHRIAWPVAHAVLPSKLRATLVELVLEIRDTLPFSVDEASLPALVQALQGRLEASEEPQHLLLPQRADVLTVLASAMLFDEAPTDLWLSRQLWERLSADLIPLRPPEPKPRSSAQGRRTRNRPVDNGTEPASPQPVPPRVFSPKDVPLQLEKFSRGFQLGVKLPVPPDALEAVIESLEDGEQRFRVNGTARFVKLDHFFREAVLPLDESLLKQGGGTHRALLQKDSLTNLPQELASWLTSLRLRPALPLLFERRDGIEVAQQRTQQFSPDSLYWVIAETSNQPTEGVTRAGPLGDFTVYSVEPSQPEAAQWLTSLGFSPIEAGSVELLTLPFIREQARTRGSLLPGDPAFALITGTGVRRGSGRGNEVSPGLYRLFPQQSPGSVVFSGTARVELGIEWEDQLPPPSSLITVEWSQPLTIEALCGGLLKLELDAPFSMRGLALKARLLDRTQRLCEQELTVSVPCVLDVASQLKDLVSYLDRSRQRSLVLELSIPRLLRTRWEVSRLPVNTPPAERSHDVWTSTTRPWEQFSSPPKSPVSALLRQPVDRHGFPCLGAGVLEHEGELKLEMFQAEPPPVRRQLESVSGTRAGVGLRPLSYAYLSWSTASTREPSARLLRAAIAQRLESSIVELLCGTDWQEAESARKAPEQPIPFIVKKLLEAGELRDDTGLQDLSTRLRNPEEAVKRELERRLLPLEPFIEDILTAQNIDDIDATTLESLRERLEAVALLVYKQLLQRHVKDAECDPDLSASDTTLREILRHLSQQRKAAEELEPLPSLILPRWLVRKLKVLSLQPGSLERLSERLLEWLSLREGLPYTWSEEGVHALLKLWCTPLAVERADVEALEAAIVDRQASRAIRYAALCWRAAAQGGRWRV